MRKGAGHSPELWLGALLPWVMQLLDGRREEAMKEFLAEDEATSRDAGLALVNHAMGKQAKSDAALNRLINEGTQSWPYGIATTFGYRAEKNKAFEWLQKAYVARDSDLGMYVLGDPLLATLHEDRRYKALLKKMNLPE